MSGNDNHSTHEPGVTVELGFSDDRSVEEGPIVPSVDLGSRKVVDFWMAMAGGQSLRGTPSANNASNHPQLSPMAFAEVQSLPFDQQVPGIPETTEPSDQLADYPPQSFSSASPATPRPTSLIRPCSANDVVVLPNYGMVDVSNQSPTEHGASVLKGLPNHWATRAGILQPVSCDEFRYLGVTSNLELDQNALMYGPSQSKGRRFRNSCEQILGAKGLHWARDAEFEAYLTAQFFLWENPFLAILSEPIYFREKARFENGDDSNLYSPILENAVYVPLSQKHWLLT